MVNTALRQYYTMFLLCFVHNSFTHSKTVKDFLGDEKAIYFSYFMYAIPQKKTFVELRKA